MNNKAQTGQIFFYEVQAKFNLREPKSNKPTNIYLVCRIDRKQIRLSTGVKVYPEHWNVKKQEAYISCRLSELDNLNNTHHHRGRRGGCHGAGGHGGLREDGGHAPQ